MFDAQQRKGRKEKEKFLSFHGKKTGFWRQMTILLPTYLVLCSSQAKKTATWDGRTFHLELSPGRTPLASLSCLMPL